MISLWWHFKANTGSFVNSSLRDEEPSPREGRGLVQDHTASKWWS